GVFGDENGADEQRAHLSVTDDALSERRFAAGGGGFLGANAHERRGQRRLRFQRTHVGERKPGVDKAAKSDREETKHRLSEPAPEAGPLALPDGAFSGRARIRHWRLFASRPARRRASAGRSRTWRRNP